MAVDFGGAPYLTYGFAPITGYPFTLACWFWVDNVTATHQLITLSDNGGGTGSPTVQISLQVAGAVASDPLRGIVGGTNSDKTSVSAGVWHHGALVCASSTSRTAYLNGVAGTTNTTSATIGAGIDNIRLGATAAGASLLDGRLAEVAVYNLALVADEIAALAKGFSPLVVQRRGLRFYADMFKAAA